MKPNYLGAGLVIVLLVFIGAGVWYNQAHSSAAANGIPYRLVQVSRFDSRVPQEGIPVPEGSEEYYRLIVNPDAPTEDTIEITWMTERKIAVFFQPGRSILDAQPVAADSPDAAVQTFLRTYQRTITR